MSNKNLMGRDMHQVWAELKLSDQEIRARALECAVRLWAGYGIRTDEQEDSVTQEFWRTVKQFEAYIRGENAG